MSRFRTVALAAVFLFGAPATSLAISNNVSVTVKPGGTVRLWSWSNFSKECRPNSGPTFVYAKKPEKGKLSVKNERWAITAVAHKDWAACVGKTMPGKRIYYTADRKASGRDTIRIVQDPTTDWARVVNVTITIK